ncbi:MAG: hypothetical protein HOP16_06270 [Acidobacteria bacterium]|nr:hypothetical protein [Acidobacteriota bacterium]
MRYTWSALACAMAMALSVVGIGNAHHGTAAYDTTTTVTITGVVTEFRFVNPHVLILWDAKDEAGVVQHWSGERSGPNSMARNAGWNRNTIKPGDEITVTGRPAKNKTTTMAISKIVLNGKELTSGGND